ncbi:hypothetical protein NLX83_15160 [Allokutzneria sp. A3M-2-11 16]|uniref:hypothetical protein n=1 Tax=Allokutzneria sp. A3M-2-11 16 TaxID=2962043 RepID=UPI0020B86527|nr:hypothetical protein [Allokutzneria sp. A3M-2-11 16]MCP3800604.1 hypothetical protein [Allokutzneria sp. A3M-2-11 16]
MSRLLAPLGAVLLLPVLAGTAHAAPTASIKPVCDAATWSVSYTATSSGHGKRAAVEVRVDQSIVEEWADHGLGAAAMGEPRRERANGSGTWTERDRLVKGTGAPDEPRPYKRTYTLDLTVTEKGVQTKASGSCSLILR